MNFRVFPCNGKISLIGDWEHLASSDPVQIKRWQDHFGSRLTSWGLPTGDINGIYALDIDVKDGTSGFDTLKNMNVPHTMRQNTPSGGAHLLYRYPQDGKRYGGRVKFLPGLDLRGAENYVVLYGTDQTPIADAPDWLLEAGLNTFSAPEGEAIKVCSSIAEGMMESSLEAIREAPAGEANNILNVESFKVGQLVAGGSVDERQAEQWLFDAAKERGQGDFEARETIKSGLKGGLLKPLTSPFDAPPVISIPAIPIPERWMPRRFTRDDLFNISHLRRPQLFKDWSTEDIHLTTADGGTGKSTLKLMEAVCLALGDPFLGFQCVQPGKTLFITGEDTAEKLGAMLGMIASQMGYNTSPEKLQIILDSIIVKKDADLCIISKDKQGFLTVNRAAMTKVMEAVDEFKPKMIVFDPISSFWGSEAGVNDMAKAVGKFMGELVTRANANVEIINHMGKQSSAAKDVTQFAGRGGTGLPSNARVSRVMHPIDEARYRELTGKDLEDGQSAILCNVNKFTDGSPLLNKPFVIVRTGYLFLREALDPAKEREEAEKAADNERVHAFIKDQVQEGRYATRKVIEAYFMSHSDKISRSRVGDAINMLTFFGFNGEMIKEIENHDALVGGKILVLTDSSGKEL
jgi:RecA-family ATPase